MRAARAAGWRRRDMWWERLQEAANVDLAEGRRDRALRRFRLALWIARLGFDTADPRRATSLANAGYAARARGSEEAARRLYERAATLWTKVPATIGGLEIRPRARSSLFHLRMEARHREAFRRNTERRLAGFVAEAGQALEALAEGRAPPHRHFARWKGERPPIYDDMRKLLGACLLIAG